MNAYSVCEPLPDTVLRGIVQQIKARKPSVRATDSSVDKLAASCSLQLVQLRSQLPASCTSDVSIFSVFQNYLSSVTMLQQEFGNTARSARADVAWSALAYQAFTGPAAHVVQEWIYASLVCVLHITTTWPSLAQAALGDVCAELAVSGSEYTADELPSHAIYTRVCGNTEHALQFLNDFEQSCKKLMGLKVLDYAKHSVLQAVDRIIDDQVQASTSQWETQCLERMQTATRFIAQLLDTRLGSSQWTEPLEQYADNALHTRFSAQREHELFGIIVDFPDSSAAIADLRACVERHRSMHAVATKLRKAVQQRLLHPGATTSDILAQYISCIRCLRLLDPSSTMLEIVASPIRTYLRSRDDTVACIIHDMVSEESELFEDLANGSIRIDAEGKTYDEDCVLEWTPLPIEAKSVYGTALRRDADVLALLVSIYDTQSVFVQEFESHVANQLLAHDGFDAAREIRQVEMMKLRFGSTALERCEVMLKDVADSKRVCQGVRDPIYSALVVSRQFWEPSPADTFTVPPRMHVMRDQFTQVFEALRPARSLEWRDAQSRIELQVEIDGRTLDVSARPSQAAALFAFQNTPQLSVCELAQNMECSEDLALSCIKFWQSHGVVRETSPRVYTTADHASNACVDDTLDLDNDASDTEDSHAPASRTDALHMHFNFIVGMLTNFGPLPLDRIHSMLAMFIPGDQTTVDELRAFLAQMVREDRLDMAGSTYKLK
ncbi:Anaphase-promoting complex subunit 2 [Coemansia sp. RSA 1807]|nr:Anaphase-promoting complex subunit 2 [Coemansia sp. RSA 921]KAJ2532431.1 Anaphase-promoting complex subunit 2 [Coemansia sp. RSA 1937]KAJ2573792.1 Anaphase-promoting complex subunit 2 [Coemansia sp. RSA 1807]